MANVSDQIHFVSSLLMGYVSFCGNSDLHFLLLNTVFSHSLPGLSCVLTFLKSKMSLMINGKASCSERQRFFFLVVHHVLDSLKCSTCRCKTRYVVTTVLQGPPGGSAGEGSDSWFGVRSGKIPGSGVRAPSRASRSVQRLLAILSDSAPPPTRTLSQINK